MSPAPQPETLGTVRCPSGDLLLLDFGLLRLWSDDDPPVLDQSAAPPAADYEIVGPDAAVVAARIDLAALKGRFAFDLTDDGALTERVADVCAREGLRAAVRPAGRLPHRQRVLRLLTERPVGAEVPFDGGWAVAVRGIPTDRELPVRGSRMAPSGPDGHRWHQVWVECDSRPVARSVPAGYVLVDEARLMFTDPLTLAGWTNDRSLDGLADLVFWGRDAADAAREIDAPKLLDPDGGDLYGWVDRPVAELADPGGRLRAIRSQPGTLFAIDARPHDDHYRLLSQANRSATGSGTIELAGSALTGFFTSWGDGAFAVYTDLAADGTVCRVRVELGAPDIVRRTRRSEELWFGDLAKLAIVSPRVARDGRPVCWIYREEPDNDRDSGWRVFAGDESQDFLDDPLHAPGLMPLRELIAGDGALEAYFRAPGPVAFERTATGDFEQCEPPEPLD